MPNPFLRRATEYIRDDSEFLSIVSPTPLTAFIADHPNKNLLFDVPVRLVGSPGSGKTMMAMLLEFRLVESVLRDQGRSSNKELAAALASCGFIVGGLPAIAAVRLPLEFQYRDFWELPYEETLRTKLMLSLIQARAVLSLCRNLTANNRRQLNDIRLIPQAENAQLSSIGGPSIRGVRARAQQVEAAIYTIGASLVPPSVEEIPAEAREPYEPFATIREIEIDWEGERRRLKPLIILDDAHTLHPDQFDHLLRALARREIRVGRWLTMRMDALSPAAVFKSNQEDAFPGLKRDRDYTNIFMQSADRGSERKIFRRMAADMADRYLKQVPSLRERSYTDFRALLLTEPPRLSAGKLSELRELVAKDRKTLGVQTDKLQQLQLLAEKYAKGTKSADNGEDIQLGMTRVLMHRYAKRISPGLFEQIEIDPPELKVDISIADASRVHLHRLYGRPFHYGLDNLCDASGENAELFLHLAGALVERMETRVIRGQDPALQADVQQTELHDKASEIVENWSFPFARKVRRLVDVIAAECLDMSQQPNARLGAGANAVGILESDMELLLRSDSELTLILKYAIAYGALIAVREYGQGGKLWCLLELSGPVCLKHGLTLKRGGFLERTVKDLIEITATS